MARRLEVGIVAGNRRKEGLQVIAVHHLKNLLVADYRLPIDEHLAVKFHFVGVGGHERNFHTVYLGLILPQIHAKPRVRVTVRPTGCHQLIGSGHHQKLIAAKLLQNDISFFYYFGLRGWGVAHKKGLFDALLILIKRKVACLCCFFSNNNIIFLAINWHGS
jgi:hypothetical protein